MSTAEPSTAAADAAASQGAGAVRVALDTTALDRWLRTNVADYAGPLSVEKFNGGQSNLTYRLDKPGRRYVLRRQPPGVLVKGAHDMRRGLDQTADGASMGHSGRSRP